MTTHTPGPWHLSDETNPLITNERGDVDVAQVFFYNDGLVGSLRPDAYADARLLAAAPDLLEALKACERALFGLGDDHRIDSAWAKSRAAIARATGEA